MGVHVAEGPGRTTEDRAEAEAERAPAVEGRSFPRLGGNRRIASTRAACVRRASRTTVGGRRAAAAASVSALTPATPRSSSARSIGRAPAARHASSASTPTLPAGQVTQQVDRRPLPAADPGGSARRRERVDQRVHVAIASFEDRERLPLRRERRRPATGATVASGTFERQSIRWAVAIAAAAT